MKMDNYKFNEKINKITNFKELIEIIYKTYINNKNNYYNAININNIYNKYFKIENNIKKMESNSQKNNLNNQDEKTQNLDNQKEITPNPDNQNEKTPNPNIDKVDVSDPEKIDSLISDTPNPDKIINIDNIDSNNINDEDINITSLIKKKSEKIYYKGKYYKIMNMINEEEFVDTYLLSSEKGQNYIIKKYKLYKLKKNSNIIFKIIKEIKYIESLNSNFINKVLHYFIEKENNELEFCILYENNKKAKEILSDTKELNLILMHKILFRLIFGIQSLNSKNINLSLFNLNSNYIFFDNDYNIKFDMISKFIIESISDEFNVLEKNDFFSAFKEKCIKDKIFNNDNPFLKQLNEKNISINELINNNIFIEKFFEYNLLDDILNSDDLTIFLYFFNKFPLLFNLNRFKWLENYIDGEPITCRNCSSYFKIYIKNKENIILKCVNCNILKSEKISYINYFSSKIKMKNNIFISTQSKYENFLTYFEKFSKVIEEKYLITKKILNNIYQTKGEDKIIYEKSIINILLYFFEDLKININLIILSSLKQDKLNIIKDYFNENEILKFKNLLKVIEENYLYIMIIYLMMIKKY